MTTSHLRTEAVRIFQAGVAAADPAGAVALALAEKPVGGRPVVIALGKAACAMMEAALAQVDATSALVVTNSENARDMAGVTVLVGEHPDPAEGSAAAGKAIFDTLAGLGPDDQVLALISGGGSALATLPVDGVSLADKQAAFQVLLRSGLDIVEMNLVRQCLSALKGGGWLRASQAPVRTLILSDVIGDDLRAVASGPTVSPIGTYAQARALLHGADVWAAMPASVQAHLQKEDVVEDRRAAENQIVGSNRVSLDAMAAACAGAVIVDDALIGDVGDAAAKVLTAMRAAPEDCTLIFGGETTVKINGDGLGGRNQELALRVAAGAADIEGDWVFLSGGTDGRDGPTDAAGGIVDAGTLSRMTRDVTQVLEANDSYHGLAEAGDLLMVGGTGTNVADVQVFLRRS